MYDDHLDHVPLHLNFFNVGGEKNRNSSLEKESLYHGFHLDDHGEGNIMVPWKFNPSTVDVLIDEKKKWHHFFSVCETAIVPYDSTDQTGLQKHIYPLNQKDCSSLSMGLE